MVGGSDCRMVVYLMMPCFFSYTGHSYKKPSLPHGRTEFLQGIKEKYDVAV